jgi:hypothetical protein
MNKERREIELLQRALKCIGESSNEDLCGEIEVFLANPEQEPLSEDKLDVLAEANITDEGIAGYYLGFRDAEKYHSIGGGNE